MVWPYLDRWRAAHLGLLEAIEKVEPNLAAGELLGRLRDVFLQVAIASCFRNSLYNPFHDLICEDFGLTFLFLYPQDAALLRPKFPQHDLFSDPIFTTPDYLQFEKAVTAAVEAATDEDPHLVAVQKAIPAVCDRLRTVTGVVKTSLESNDSSMRSINSSLQHMERRMATLENVVTNFCGGAFTFTPGNRRPRTAVSPSCGSSLVWAYSPSIGYREPGGTAANIPLVA